MSDFSLNDATSQTRPSVRAQPKPRHGDATNLYVGSLHAHVTDTELIKRFSPFGQVVSAKVMLNIHTGESRGMGFVKFANRDSAIAALQALHRSMLCGQRILVRFADARADYHPGEKTNRVFVRNLPLDVTAAQVRSLFQPHGTVDECNLQLDSAGWKNGGNGVRTRMAFVTMSTVAEADAAAAAVHATRPFPTCQASLMAKIAESDNRRQERKTSSSPAQSNSGSATTPQTANSNSGMPSSTNGSSTPPGSEEPTSSNAESSKGGRTSSSDCKTSSEDDDMPVPNRRAHRNRQSDHSVGSSSPAQMAQSRTPLPFTPSQSSKDNSAISPSPGVWPAAVHGFAGMPPTAHMVNGATGPHVPTLANANMGSATAMPPPQLSPYMYPFPPAMPPTGAAGFPQPFSFAPPHTTDAPPMTWPSFHAPVPGVPPFMYPGMAAGPPAPQFPTNATPHLAGPMAPPPGSAAMPQVRLPGMHTTQSTAPQ